jgi:hypothetical protein
MASKSGSSRTSTSKVSGSKFQVQTTAQSV